MASALLPQGAVLAWAAFTAEVLDQFPQGGLRLGSVADLGGYYADDPVAGTDCASEEVGPVVDYERAVLLHGSP